MVNRLLWITAIRHLVRQPWQTWLSILGIALGVAVIVAVDLANQSARSAFLLSAESLTGKATHQIVANGTQGIAESYYRRLRMERHLRASAPIVEGQARSEIETLQLVGIDPLAEGSFRAFGVGPGSGVLTRFIAEPNTALLSSVTAKRLGLSAGSAFAVTVAGKPVNLLVLDTFTGDNPAALEGLLLVDISSAQELLGRAGVLDRIDLILTPEQAESLTRELPPGLRLEVPASRTRIMSEMIAAFQTNLSAMSLLAILVGAFLIYNTMTFSVLRRLKMLGTLRLLGVSRRALFWVILLEAGLLGILGTASGLLLGTLTAHHLIQLVTRTINDLYFLLTVTQLIIEPLTLIKGVVIGLCVTLLAALPPALEAAGAQPLGALGRTRLERRVHRWLPWLTVLGFILTLSGWLLTRLQEGSLMLGFTGLFLVILGYSLLIPLAVNLCSRIGRSLIGHRVGMFGRMALRSIDANLSRTGLSVAALTIAVAATLGVSIMITSFRSTVADWLGYTLRSDIYVSAASGAGGAEGILPASVRSRIQSLDIVAETSSGRRLEVVTEYGQTHMLAMDMAKGSRDGFKFLKPPDTHLWSDFSEGRKVLVSEPFAYRHRLEQGDDLLIHTPEGDLILPIGGVFFDYGSDRGLLVLSRTAYERYWGEPAFSTVGVFLRTGIDSSRAISALSAQLQDTDIPLRIRSNREIRAQSLEVFDRTFAITRVLRLLAVGVAFVGVLSALMALQLERGREQAILRATGATTGQLSRYILMQTGIMGLYAGVLSLPLGWMMSEVLIDVINRRSFGWSILTQIPPSALAEALLLALGSALLAGLYPAWRMTRVQPALALREE